MSVYSMQDAGYQVMKGVVGGVGCLGSFGSFCSSVCGGARFDKSIHGARAVLLPIVHTCDAGGNRAAGGITGSVSVHIERVGTVI